MSKASVKICLGKNEIVSKWYTKQNPQSGNSGGFFLGLVVAISIKPFADIVASYACYDRDKK